MNPKYKWQLLLIISFLLIVFILALVGYRRAYNYSFNGIIENVTYNSKNNPTITIKGEDYDLTYNTWGNYKNPKIEVGDTAIKKKGELSFILKKRNECSRAVRSL